LLYKIPHVVVGENRTFVGAEDLLRSRGVVLDIIDDKRCVELLQDFIRENPALWSEDISVYEDELACCS
jgi:cytosine deaminase